MSAVIQIVGSASGAPTGAEGKFVREFTPAAMRRDGTYAEGGSLVLCDSIERARHFRDAGEAMRYYRQARGFRPDGRPNRPLTSYTVEIVSDDGVPE